jgi:hypothetical protein
VDLVQGSPRLSEQIGHSDVAFTMKQYEQTDLDVHRQVATTLAELILGGVLLSGVTAAKANGERPDERRAPA